MIRLTAATAIAAAGLVGALAAPATATPPPITPVPNYGACVSTGTISPADVVAGPLSLQGLRQSDGKGGTATTGFLHSDGQSRFSTGLGCPH
jgi:hypothetical protein